MREKNLLQRVRGTTVDAIEAVREKMAHVE